MVHSVKEIFGRALAIQSMDERNRYLDEACAGDEPLRAEVTELLEAMGRAGGFLGGSAASETVKLPISEQPGDSIGPYKLLQLIGEGGFGNVYLAEQQQPVRRKVALKIIKLGMDTRAVIARFEAERQAVALMDHPNIAKVLDAAATQTGRPYFVMELVRGLPMTEYCDQHDLTVRERLGLFMDVCQGIQHAHQKGIIHRDIKPSNVLVTQQDGRPIPKIIDFGVAKATQQRLTEKTLFTEHRQLVGTPEYMSPEQATFYEADVDTRSDIYSLGVLLYELLAGKTPFDAEALRKRGYDEICRVIRETEPPTPSQRFSKLADAATTAISQRRHAEPATLRRLLRGDLDWIAMKCLEKDRARRYETAHSLARDIERHLGDEPVRARAPTIGYRIAKVMRKHRYFVAAATVVAATIVLGLILSSVSYFRAEQARRVAVSERNRADENAAQANDLTQQTRRQLYVSDVNSAYQAWEDGNIGRVRELLERHLPRPDGDDLRGFEWHYLSGEYQRALAIPSVIHGRAASVAYSPDGTILASAGGDVKLWDATTRKQLRTFRHKWAKCIAFSPDGTLLASGGVGQIVYLWNPATGEQVGQLSTAQAINALAFSPDSKLLAAGCGDRLAGELRLWDVATGAEVGSLSGHTASVATVAFSPDGKVLASGGRDRTIRLWDVELGAALDTLGVHTAGISALAFSPRGARLASGEADGSLKLWDMSSLTVAAEFPGAIRSSNCLAFSPSGATLAVGTVGNRVWIWDVDSTRTTVLRTGHPRGGVGSIAFSPDGASLATVGTDGVVQIADTPCLADTTSVTGTSDWYASLAVSPADGSVLAVGVGGIKAGVWSGELVLWDVARRQAHRLTEGPVYSVCFSPDGRILASSAFEDVSSSSGARVNLWDVASRNLLRTLDGHEFFIPTLAFSPDGKLLASGDWGNASSETPDTGDWGGTIKLWDVATGRMQRSASLLRYAVSSLAFSPDGRHLVICGGKWAGGDIKLWQWDREQAPVTIARSEPGASDVVFSPDGTLFATADVRGTLKLWNFADLQSKAAFEAHSGIFHSVAFSPDGRTLASGSQDRTVRLWHVDTGGELATFHTDMPVNSVAFFPDGKTLAACCWDQSVILWHADEEKEVLRAPSEP